MKNPALIVATTKPEHEDYPALLRPNWVDQDLEV
jgi:hypothetical protein